MSSCPNDEDTMRVFVLAHVLTNPFCFLAQVCVFCFTLKHLLELWRKGRISRGSMICALGYFSASIANQIDGLIAWVLTPALNLSRRAGAAHCQTQSFFGWISAAFSYLFLVLFWVERLRQTFKCSIFQVSDKNLALIQGFWFTIFFIEVVLGTYAGVETRCSAPSKVLDYNAFSMKTPHYCASTNRGQMIRALYSAFGAVMILMIQVTLGYMYVSRLKTLFVDSGKPLREIRNGRVDAGKPIEKEMTLVSVNSALTATPVGCAEKKQKRGPKLRTKMTQSELDYFRKTAIIALTSSVSTFVASILVAFAGVYFVYFWDLLLNALLITASFKFGTGIYDRLFCCCQRVCVATVDRATSMRSAVKNSPAQRPSRS